VLFNSTGVARFFSLAIWRMRKRLIILIIDDSRMIIERLTLLLTELENVERILQASTYAEGEDVLKKEKVNAIMLDINLPEGDGTELLRAVREKNYPVGLIIVITDHEGGKKRELCKSLGADHYMNKFDDIEKIEKIISDFQ
jgi:DNA-binding NarL/FixJ family response regulator